MRTTCILNQKGGCGKTTTAAALSAGLTARGYKALAIDADPQCNLSYALDCIAMDEDPSLYDVMKGARSAESAIRITSQCAAIPGDIRLAAADIEFNATGREYKLREALQPVKEFSHVIIDCPPGLGILAINALTAADDVIVPCGADIFSLQGLQQLLNTIAMVQKYSNKDLQIAGLLITRKPPRGIATRELMEAIRSRAGSLKINFYETTIREAAAIREAQLTQESIFSSHPKAAVTNDYNQLIDEYLKQEA